MSSIGLQADCDNCFGLCCVAPTFSASVDFAFDKALGEPCPNLGPDFQCGIHSSLRDRGFRGCAVFDCFGSGQKVSQVTFGGQDWIQAPETAEQMFAVFGVMRQLHELLWYLTAALSMQPGSGLQAELRSAIAETERLTRGTPDAIAAIDVEQRRGEVTGLLRDASQRVRSRASDERRVKAGADLKGADLLGADFREADLFGASLKGAVLIRADLSGADLRFADVIGADFRDAIIVGADLTNAVFLTQAQLNAAKGNATTNLPPTLARPPHWQFDTR
jgi:uncharacterized protein YjbI with pentapeptide repeats